PADHPLLSIDEVKRIKKGKHTGVGQPPSPSIRSVLSSPAVWAVFIAAMGTYFVLQFLFIFSPQYFSFALGYSPTFAGTLTIIPTVATMPVKLLTGLVSDRLTRMSEVGKMRLFNSLASFGGAIFFALVILVSPTDNKTAATAFTMVPFVLYAFTSCGFSKSTVMISREHSPFVFSLMHITNMISMLAATFFIPLLTPDNTYDQWKIVFGM
ncbi:hypothetical protein PMAYCL1PPCAC_15749, partial [Pristionchus mayeri]